MLEKIKRLFKKATHSAIALGDAPEFPDDISSSNNPRTGDESHLMLWLALAATSASGLIAIAFVSNRNRTLFSYKGRHTRK